jgi:flavin reductase (DIM6/NTAB) family NADH-FMN oxidoreductase RutF
VEGQRFRDALGRFASGVTIVTTREGERDYGATVSAFSSVSLAPPLVLCCFRRESDTARAILDRRRFAVSLLAADQEEVARRFAAPLADRFGGIPVGRTDDGIALIEGATAHLICSVASHVDAGDHLVVFGHVHRTGTADLGPLVVFRSAFGSFQQ